MRTIDINQKSVRVLIVDDQKSIRQSLKLSLEANSQIVVVDMAEDGVTALEKIAALQPDIAIIDLDMPGMNGITMIEIINERFLDTKTLVLSSYDEREYIDQAIAAGAKGYFLKGTGTEKLQETVLQINQGYFQLNTSLSEEIVLDTFDNLEDEYLAVKIDEIQVALSEKTDDENIAPVNSDHLNEMRREIIDILEFKIHLLESKKNYISHNLQKLQRKFSWLLASQVILFLIVLSSTSTVLKLKQQSAINIQNSQVVNTSQSVK